jgi:serine-type D-Ala-D-Ala endopeptidase (penicillin-binding protein 7)
LSAKLLAVALAGVMSLFATLGPAQADNQRTASLTHPVDPAAVSGTLLDPAYQRRLQLRSAAVLVIDELTGAQLYASRADRAVPIASLTKLMTAMVILDAGLPLDAQHSISDEDFDRLRGTGSRLSKGATLTRRQMLHLALMSSENRAAAALARTYPGGTKACIAAMNRKAAALGLHQTHFADATGLDGRNRSSAEDLARLVHAAHGYAMIKEFSTSSSQQLALASGAPPLEYRNTNPLVRKPEWEIGLSKTGYINESGRCLVMQAKIAGRPTIIVLLNAQGKYSGVGDANRIRKWIEGAGIGQLADRS